MYVVCYTYSTLWWTDSDGGINEQKRTCTNITTSCTFNAAQHILIRQDVCHVTVMKLL